MLVQQVLQKRLLQSSPSSKNVLLFMTLLLLYSYNNCGLTNVLNLALSALDDYYQSALQEFTLSPCLRCLRVALALSAERAAKPSLSGTLDGLSVGSELLVKVINLSKEPIRLQFRRLMAARRPTARVGPTAKRVVAFMLRDERKTSSVTSAVSAIR